MHARSITIHGRPDKVGAGIRFVTTEAAPMLARIEGCRGLSLLVDRATGQCIVTSSWADEASMLASTEQLRPLRERGHDLMGGSMQIDEWEIVAMHRTQHGEACRVSWLEGDVESMVDSFRLAVLPRLEDLAGFCGASLMVDRGSGTGCATTVWRDRAAMDASAVDADDMRARVASDAGGRIVDVHGFELVHAHLHVPEMA